MVEKSSTKKRNWNWQNEISQNYSQSIQKSNQRVSQVIMMFSIQTQLYPFFSQSKVDVDKFFLVCLFIKLIKHISNLKATITIKNSNLRIKKEYSTIQIEQKSTKILALQKLNFLLINYFQYNQQLKYLMKAQNQNQPVDNDQKKQQYSHIQFVLPDECKKLRGCNKCGLLKTKSQWDRKHACENCGIFQRQQTNQNTSKTYFGIIGIIDPKGSFIRKKAKIYSKNGQKLKSGIYGI